MSTADFHKEKYRQQALQVAIAQHKAGNLAAAKDLYEKVLQAEPRQPVALHLLGVIAHQSGHQEIALDLIGKAIEIKPDYDEAHNNLGNVLKSLGRMRDAVTHYQLSIELKSDAADPHYNLATAYENLDLTDEAIACYLRSIELNPRYAAAHFNLGNMYRRLGKFEDALLHLRNAIAIVPDYAEAYRVIAGIKKYTAYDHEVQQMEALIQHPAVGDRKKMHLAFGLGKALEDLGDFQRSFALIEQANAIKRRSFNFKIENWDTYVERHIRVFDSALFERLRDTGCSDPTPVFILGMPRSGTSLVEQILASHPDVHAAGEVHTLSETVAEAFDFADFPENVVQADGASIRKLGERYVQRMQENAASVALITDKMPDNFKFIGMMKLMLPNAKIIHCIRDPMDNCLSLYKNHFAGHDQEYSYDQVELGRYYKGYSKLMKHWHKTLPGYIYDFRYEDIVREQEPQTRALLRFCGLEWDDACLTFYATGRAVKTASAAQVRRPIFKDSVQLWKRYEKQLAPLRQCLFEHG